MIVKKIFKSFITFICIIAVQVSYSQPTVPSGFSIRTVASGGVLAGQILDGIVADPVTGNVYVAAVSGTNSSSFNLYKITPAGAVSLVANFPFAHNEVVKMAFGPDGNIYTVDGNTGTMKKIDPVTATATTFATGLSSARHGLNFDPAGNLIIAYESLTTFSKVTPTGLVNLGSVSAATPNGNHGDAFGIQPNGNYVVYVDCGGQNNYAINTAGHVAGNNYTTLAWTSTTNIFTSLMPGACGYSNGAIDPNSGNVYSTITNFGNGNSRILFTGANGGATTLFVDGAQGITDLCFGRESSLGNCSSLYFVDRTANKIYEVPMNNCCFPVPDPVTVNGGGSFCGSTTITASGGNGGVIYFQGTTTNGTSTAYPSSSEVITSSGKYYFRAKIPGGCWGEEGSVTVTIRPNPAAPVISPAGNITYCAGSPTTTTLSIPPTNTSFTSTYNITAANLINLINSCAANNFYGNGQVGFNWTDAGAGIVTNVQVKFSVGVECSAGMHTTSLNTFGAPSFATIANCTCSAPGTEQIKTLNLNPANYILGGVNTLLMNASTFGLITAATLGGNFAQVTVTYSTIVTNLWSPGGQTTNSITVSPANTTNYTVTITDVYGCSASASKVITVNPLPTITCPANITTDAEEGICAAHVNFSAAATGIPAPVITYSHAPGSVFPVGITTVTATATNSCGTVSCTFDVTVEDHEIPSINCPANIAANATSAAGAVVNYTAPVGTDNCPGSTTSLTAGLASGSTFPIGTTTVTHTVTDASGNTADCSFTVTVTGLAPQIVCPADITVNNDNGQCGAIVNFAATETVAIPASTITYSQNPGTFFPKGTTTVTATAVNAVGTSTCTFTVTVNDAENPTITCNAPVEVSNDEGQCGAMVTYNVTSADNCPGETIAQTAGLPSGSIFPVGTTTNTFVVTDASGNTATCSFTVTVFDNVVPVINCPSGIILCGSQVVNYNMPTAYDDCSALITQTSGLPSGAVFPVGTTVNTFTATDPSGNSASCSFNVTINPIPVVNVVTSQTVCNNGSTAAVNFTGFVPATVYNWTNNTTSIGLAANGTGNIASFTALNPTNAPVTATITVTPQYTNGDLTCTGQPRIFTIRVNPTAIINPVANKVVCYGAAPGATVFSSPTTGGTIIYTWTNNTPAIGLAASGTGNIPNFIAKNSTNAPLVATITVTPSFGTSGNCSGIARTFTITVNPTPNFDNAQYFSGILSASDPVYARPEEYNQGGTCVVSTRSDAGTAVHYKTHTFTLTEPSNVLVSLLNSDGGLVVPTNNNLNIDPFLQLVGPGGFVPSSSCTNSIAANDDAGFLPQGRLSRIATTTPLPAGTYTVVVTTWDNTPGVFSNTDLPLPWNYTLAVLTTSQTVCNNSATTALNFNTTVPVTVFNWTNNNTSIGLGASGSGNIPSFTAINTGLNPVTATITVTPSYTNAGLTCTGAPVKYYITVNPTPTITCPGNQTANHITGTCSAIVNYNSSATGTPIPAISYVFTGATVGSGSGNGSGSSFNVGVTTVTLTATNNCGTPVCTFTVTVIDEEAPTIICNAPIVVSNDEGQCGAVVTYSVTSSDNCPGQTVVQTAGLPSGSFFPKGVTTNTFVVTDASGNTATCSFTVTVNDTENPAITCPADITVNCQDDNSSASTGTATADDNCTDIESIVITQFQTSTQTATGTGHYNYVISRTWRATDESGNYSECTQTITVHDVTAPVITCPANVTLNCQDNNTSSATGVATATDNCSAVDITQTQTSTQDPNPANTGYYNYVISRTWRATDESGNFSECTQTITVRDITAPVALCKPVTITLVNGAANITASGVNNGSYDNCSPVTLSVSKTSFNCSNIGNNTVTLTVTDVSGNSSTCTAIVTVVGEIPSCSITVIPGNNIYTGGVPTNLYLGYGPQTLTLQVSAPASGAPYTYAWSGGVLTNYNTANPVFTAATAGLFTYTVLVTNKYGCITTCSVTICVKDIRVSGSPASNMKVYVCHNGNTISVSTNAVASHIPGHPGDRLGSCSELPCGSSNSLVSSKGAEENVTVVVAAPQAELSQADFRVNVYPNPSAYDFSIQVISKSNEPVTVRILDLNGKVRTVQTQLSKTNSIKVGNDLTGGTYFAEVTQGGNKQVVKLVKLN